MFNQSFPGKILKQTIKARSTFSTSVQIQNIKFSDDRFYVKPVNYTINHGKNNYVFDLVYDPSKGSDNENYNRIPYFVNYFHGLITLDDLYYFNKNKQVWDDLLLNNENHIRANMELQTNINSNMMLQIKAGLFNLIDFGENLLNIQYTQTIKISNPTDKVISLSFFLGSSSIFEQNQLEDLIEDYSPLENKLEKQCNSKQLKFQQKLKCLQKEISIFQNIQIYDTCETYKTHQICSILNNGSYQDSSIYGNLSNILIDEIQQMTKSLNTELYSTQRHQAALSSSSLYNKIVEYILRFWENQKQKKNSEIQQKRQEFYLNRNYIRRVIYINPRSSISIPLIDYKPVQQQISSSSGVLLIKNNLTGLEIIQLKGTAKKQILQIVSNQREVKVGNRTVLMDAMNSKDNTIFKFYVERDEVILLNHSKKQENLINLIKNQFFPGILKRIFHLKNTGNSTLIINNISISNCGCSCLGFSIENCTRKLYIYPQETLKLQINFIPFGSLINITSKIIFSIKNTSVEYSLVVQYSSKNQQVSVLDIISYKYSPTLKSITLIITTIIICLTYYYYHHLKHYSNIYISIHQDIDLQSLSQHLHSYFCTASTTKIYKKYTFQQQQPTPTKELRIMKSNKKIIKKNTIHKNPIIQNDTNKKLFQEDKNTLNTTPQNQKLETDSGFHQIQKPKKKIPKINEQQQQQIDTNEKNVVENNKKYQKIKQKLPLKKKQVSNVGWDNEIYDLNLVQGINQGGSNQSSYHDEPSCGSSSKVYSNSNNNNTNYIWSDSLNENQQQQQQQEQTQNQQNIDLNNIKQNENQNQNENENNKENQKVIEDEQENNLIIHNNSNSSSGSCSDINQLLIDAEEIVQSDDNITNQIQSNSKKVGLIGSKLEQNKTNDKTSESEEEYQEDQEEEAEESHERTSPKHNFQSLFKSNLNKEVPYNSKNSQKFNYETENEDYTETYSVFKINSITKSNGDDIPKLNQRIFKLPNDLQNFYTSFNPIPESNEITHKNIRVLENFTIRKPPGFE